MPCVISSPASSAHTTIPSLFLLCDNEYHLAGSMVTCGHLTRSYTSYHSKVISYPFSNATSPAAHTILRDTKCTVFTVYFRSFRFLSSSDTVLRVYLPVHTTLREVSDVHCPHALRKFSVWAARRPGWFRYFFSQFWIVHWYIFQQTGLHAFWCLSFYSNECDFILSPKHLFVLPSFFRSYLNPSLAKTSTTPCDSVSLLNPIIMYTQHAHLPINQRTRRHLSTHINTDFLIKNPPRPG